MELVPIVIEVLKIVTVLAVVTLVASYVAYKIRQKTAPPDLMNNENNTDLKPNFVNRGIKRLTQMTKEIVHIPSHPAKPVKPSPPPKQQVIRKETPPPRKVESKETPKAKRIEVIQNLPQREEPKIEKREIRDNNQKATLNSLGDDILDKYVDDTENDMFTLKTKKNENNK